MITYPARPQEAAQNQFKRYAVAMPADLMPALRKRIYTVLLEKLYGKRVLHDLDTMDLISLDNLFVALELDEAHNLVVDGFHLGVLRRFIRAERAGIYAAKTPLTTQFDNGEYWGVLTDLLVVADRPTLVVDVSFWP